MYRIYHVPESVLKRKEVYANRWHCDEDNTTFVKLFVYLTDVTEKDGPFHIHTKESTKQIIKMGFGNRDNYNVPITVLEEKDVIKPTGNRGTVFMCNCELGLHRAGIPVEGHYRDVIMMQFRPSQKPMQNEYIENFEEPTEINRK